MTGIMPQARPSSKRSRSSASSDMLNASILYSAEAEKAVLGCMMAQPSEVIPDATETLRKEDFFVPAHQELFRVLAKMFDALQAIDVMTIHQQLIDEKLAESIGSPGILAELLIGFATHLNVGSYFRIVKEKSLQREMASACQKIVTNVQEGFLSTAEILDDAETLICGIGKNSSKGRILTLKQCCDKYRIRREAIQIGDVTPRIPTGIEAIDSRNGGLPIPSYVIIAGEMGMGKSDLVLEITRYRAMNNLGGVGIFSLEMTEEDIVGRLVSERSNINSRRLTGKLHAQEEETEEWALQQIEGWNVHIDPTSGLTPSDIRRRTRRMVDAGCNLIFLDNGQLMKGSNDRQERHLQLTEVSRTIQEVYKEHSITFCIVLQVKQDNAGKGKLLGMYDLADSAAWQRDGRVIIVINPTDGNHPDNATPILLNTAKFSEGKVGVGSAIFNKETHRIW